MQTPSKIFRAERVIFFIIAAVAIVASIVGCKQEKSSDSIAYAKTVTLEEITEASQNRVISQTFKDYWYSGEAEITSYKLEQARYGELREGTAALIFVTEDFLKDKQVKADEQNDSNIPVLKLNSTKNFNTGIYPYSVMTSTFYPVFQEGHAIKVSQSMQEWCGHMYAQINNRGKFEVSSHSYFEGQADQNTSLPKDILENELWTQLRIDPKGLPTGSFKSIPDLSFIRMKHAPLKAYSTKGKLAEDSYTLEYPELNRTLVIHFAKAFPHTISGWEETYNDGYGAKAKSLTTKATAIKTIKSAYWGKNSNADAGLRKELGLN